MSSSRGISVIIPTYNEVKTIKVLLEQINSLKTDNEIEIVVVDAKKSTDNLGYFLEGYNVQYIKSNHTSRSIQLNEGARMAKYDILYFVHADVIPPADFKEKIIHSIEKGFSFGYFRYEFNSKNILLKINSYFSQFKSFYTGGGDQTFYIKKELFEEKGGFDESLNLCEDFDLFDKLRKEYDYEIINSKAIVSDRKYQKCNYFKVNLVNFYILLKFRRGHNTRELKKTYEKLIT